MTSLFPLEDALSETEAIVRTAMADLPPELLDPAAPRLQYDLFVVLPRDAEFGLAHRALDLLATTFSDWFGSMRLQPPAAYQSEVMLHARIGGPDGESVRLGIESALRAMMLEFLGEEASVAIAVVIVKPIGPVSATLQAFFPEDLDLTHFAIGFGTRGYFRWQLALGGMEGVGAVVSEPCTALGVDLPGGHLLPPNLMITFTVLGDLESTVRNAAVDLRRRLSDATQPTEIDGGISVTLQDTTPEIVDAEIGSWRARGYSLISHDERALASAQAETALMFEIPGPWLAGER